MFEFKIAFKYLLFRKRRLSSSLITLLSIFVISIVVWLVLVFLSVTGGIEKNWLKKLTTLNAPIRIAPTEKYYSSYYYLVDSHSSKSNYLAQNISEKLDSAISDPYDDEIDMELPISFPKPVYENNKLIDPIKKLYSVLEEQKKENRDVTFQDYEISAAMMRLTLNRSKKDLFTEFKDEKVSFLTQMSYILSEPQNNPTFHSLILDPTKDDLNHILHQMDRSYSDAIKDIPTYPTFVDGKIFQKRIKTLFDNIAVEKIELEKGYSIDLDFFKKDVNLNALALIDDQRESTIILTDDHSSYSSYLKGKITKNDNGVYFHAKDTNYKITSDDSIHLGNDLFVSANLDQNSLKNAKSFTDVKLDINGKIQASEIFGKISLKDVNLNKVKIFKKNIENPLFYNKKTPLINNGDKNAILLPKNYQNNSVLIGDNGYLSYSSMTLSSNQEMRIPIYVAGFYDPGVLPIGNKCIIASKDITKTINATNNTFSFDGTPTNGVYVWFNDLKKANQIKDQIVKKLQNENIASFFNVTTYKDFEFSKDLMQQFQSDRTLFSIIAVIILIAACTNIISMLVLLVNDKKKEIAILRSMGATSKSIATIFGFCGFFMGIISSFLGIALSIITLKNLDSVIRFLSTIQGHSFFNAAFFGSKMPNEISMSALIFVLVITPILAVIAGLIPAIKASRVHPSSILRSQ